MSFDEYDIDKGNKYSEMKKRTDRKTVPQIFIDGDHIGGYDELIELERSGKLNKKIGITAENYSDRSWELIIIGAGPAGINAALYAARKGIEVLLISKDIGGQVIDTEEVGNYIGMIDANGAEIIDAFWEHAHQYNVASILGEKVETIETGEEEHIIKTDNDKQYKTKAVIIASGTKKRRLGMKQEYVLSGNGVHYCAICDGYKYAGSPVAVVGGGNSGLEASLDLAKLDCDVTLIELQDKLMGDKYLQEKAEENDSIDIFTSTVVDEIIGEEKLNSVIIKNNETDADKKLDIDALFIEIGLVANSDFVSKQLETNQRKEIVINKNNETNVKGIWAAGDVTDIKDKQIIISAAEGAKAALRVDEYLKSN